MKKTLLALAVLAASGAAFAQSSATLYGRVDLNFTKLTGKDAQMADGSAFGGGASRIGLRGTEDLGGGLKANFVIETQVSADANTLATTFGNRNSWVGLSGGFGAIQLGRQLNPALFHVGTYSAFGTDYGMASGSNVLNIDGARYNNSIAYFTPAMSGFTAQIHTAMKEADTFVAGSTPVGATKNPLSARFNYAAGPVSAGLAITTNGRPGPKAMLQVGASYNLGVAKLMAQFEQDGNQAKKNAYSVGVTAPVGAALIRATYGKDDSSAKTQLAFGADYALSKRTALYGVFAQTKVTGATANKQMTFGVGHSF